MNWEELKATRSGTLMFSCACSAGHSFAVVHDATKPGLWSALKLDPTPTMRLGTFLLQTPPTRNKKLGTYTGMTHAMDACARAAGEPDSRHNWPIPKGWRMRQHEGITVMEPSAGQPQKPEAEPTA